MDFKTRFQGKTSKITRDGDLEGNKADFDVAPTSLLPPARGNSIHKNDRVTPAAAADRSNLNITRNSRFSYKGSEQSTAKKQNGDESFISKPIEKLPAERININSMYNFEDQDIKYGAAKPGIANSAKRTNINIVQSPVPPPQNINNSHMIGNQMGTNDYLIKTPNANSNRNLGQMHDTQNSNFSRQYSHQNYSVGSHLAAASTENNVYLNGAKNMADAIRQSHLQPNDYMNNQAANSIAMRMKQNKDAQYGVPPSQGNNFNQTPSSGHALYAQNPFSGLGQNLNQTPFDQQSYNEPTTSRQQLINQMQGQKKPPSQQSHFQQLRESREKERHDNLTNVSKQIVSPEPMHNSGYYDDATSKVSHGLPPSGSPNKRKVHPKQQQQPIKPPSNYGKANRQQSYNRIAPPQKGMDIGSRLSRDKSSDGILNRGQLQQLDNINQIPQDPMLQNQQQLQQQLALMQQQMMLIQQQQAMAQGMNGQFKSVYNPTPQNPVENQLTNIMPNTTYDTSNGISKMIDSKDNVSVAGSEKIRYQKYSLKDYKQQQSSIKNQKMGGLGANIGGENWEKAKRKKEIARQYADNLKQMNAIQQHTRSTIQQSQPLEKEKTSREKAIEFSKNNVPKPKQRKVSQAESSTVSNQIRQLDEENSQYQGYSNQNNVNVVQMINYNIRVDEQYQQDAPQDMNRLMQDHDKYADEIEKIKAMLADNE